MTDPTHPTNAPRTRRALLAGAVGGALALAAAAIGRPIGARAADNDTMRVGTADTATSPTTITNSTDGDDVLRLASTSGRALKATTAGSTRTAALGQATAGGVGVMGVSGGLAGTPAKVGVYGYANLDPASTGVYGQSVMGDGVRGRSGAGYGVYGFSDTDIGVIGQGARRRRREHAVPASAA
jgi:hypothetical protein